MLKKSKSVQKSKSSPKDYKFNQSQLKWLEALESGKYKRCTSELCHIENSKCSFCCLGVASELFCKKVDILDIEDLNYRTYENEGTYAPPSVVKKLRLNDEFGSIKVENIKGYRKEDDTLAQFNDSGMSFKEIAVFIRKHPKQVFKS